MASTKTVAALLFDRFELLDVFGPLEAYGMLAAEGAMRVVTIAERAGAIPSAQGPSAIADFGLDTAPQIDLLLVPGGIGTRREVSNEALEALLGWLRERASACEIVTSVCTGAALLARAGILDGRRATTNKRAFGWVVEQGPRVEWTKQARWVEDGNIFTSSGVSAGIDMTLAVIARIISPAEAERIAIQMEYDWHRDAGWDPFAKVHGLV